MSRTTVSIMKITKQLERISGLDGIVADILESEERHITQLVNMIIKQYPEVSIFNNYRICSAKDEQAEELKQQLEAKNIELAGKLTDEEVFQYGCMLGDAHKKISELKRLLKFAVEDLHYYTNENTIHFLCDICCKNPVDCAEKDECYFEWEHADEVKELLDDDEK